MAKPIAKSMEEAIRLGFTPSTRSIDEIHKMIDEQIRNNPDSQAFRRDCLGLQQGEQCLQSDCGPDGRMFVGFCDGLSCKVSVGPCR
jgi:hypothetical protein